MAKYTFEEAFDIVGQMEQMCSTMPTAEDYVKLSHIADVEDLADALGVRNDLGRLNIRAYAGVNIAVLHERRKRAGKPIFIASGEESTANWNHHGAPVDL